MIITLELSETDVLRISGACMKAERPEARKVMQKIAPAISELSRYLKPVWRGDIGEFL
ncbi:MAG: hypothetical protein WA197_23090 [Candidatus Acidiferrales bacterium]